MRYIELERVVCAAAINEGFRERLLADPVGAASAGFFGQTFQLAAEELDLIVDIRAQTLQQFAEQVSSRIAERRNGHNGNGHRLSREDPLSLPISTLAADS